jgi:predicted nucleic acid-binding Zn ribbon protein
MEKNQAIQLFWVDVSRAVSNAKANKLQVHMERFSSDQCVEFRLIAGESIKEIMLKDQPRKKSLMFYWVFLALVYLLVGATIYFNGSQWSRQKDIEEAAAAMYLDCTEQAALQRIQEGVSPSQHLLHCGESSMAYRAMLKKSMPDPLIQVFAWPAFIWGKV